MRGRERVGERERKGKILKAFKRHLSRKEKKVHQNSRVLADKGVGIIYL